jgi:hypothetical protein
VAGVIERESEKASDRFLYIHSFRILAILTTIVVVIIIVVIIHHARVVPLCLGRA